MVFHTVEKSFPLRGKIPEKFSIVWKILRLLPPEPRTLNPAP